LACTTQIVNEGFSSPHDKFDTTHDNGSGEDDVELDGRVIREDVTSSALMDDLKNMEEYKNEQIPVMLRSAHPE
jgi:hypothetical protein